ncbi:uncharacterized protein LOC142317394 isoform X2 [Lycorma delicatula]|uniref:uncharacterized protein LOC142317394 isoform X2 n=1 Tax=Lycorma delicatula TaxID=130591 RepID=UPI003F510D5F
MVRVAAGRLIGLFFSFRPVSDIQKHSMEMALERFTSSLNKCFIIDDSAYTEEGEGMWSGGESRDDSPQQIYPSTWTAQKRFNTIIHMK